MRIRRTVGGTGTHVTPLRWHRAEGFESKRVVSVCVGAVFFANFHVFSAPGIFPFPPPPYGVGGWKVEFHRFFHLEFHVEITFSM
jgi:hypothetical protein